MDEQQDRIQRIFFLIKEVPHPPRLKGATSYNFQELLEFEQGKKELRLNSNLSFGGRGRGGGLGSAAKYMRKEYNKPSAHETSSEPFKPGYTMTEKQTQEYLQKMHGRTAKTFGVQSEEDRIK